MMRVCAKHYTGNRGVYAHVVPDYNSAKLLSGLVRLTRPPFATYTVPYTSHVTVICSDRPIKSVRLPYPKRAIVSRISHAEYWKYGDKQIAVFVLNSPLFKHLNSLFTQRGAKHRHAEYVPHVTIALDVQATPEEMRLWMHRSNLYLRQENHALTFNRLKVRDMHF